VGAVARAGATGLGKKRYFEGKGEMSDFGLFSVEDGNIPGLCCLVLMALQQLVGVLVQAYIN